MEFRAIYKCRLCGTKFHRTETGNAELVYKNVVELTSLGYSLTPQAPTMTTPHICPPGSYGIADFQGWEKVD